MKMSSGKIISHVVFLLLLLIPLIHFSVFNPYEFPKFLFFIISIQLLLWIFAVNFFLKTQRIKFPKDFLTILVLIFAVLTFISDIFGLDPKVSFLGSAYRHQGFITLFSGILFFLILRFFSTEKFNINLYRRGILIGAFFACLFVFYQAFLFYFSNAKVLIGDTRFAGTFGNPNFLGGYLAMVLPFILLIKRKFLKIIFITMILPVVMLSFSRSAILALLTILIIYFLSKLTKKFSIAFCCFIILLLAAFLIFSKTDSFLQIVNKRNSIWDNRILIWTEGFKAVTKQPILGYGQENFELIFPKERKMKVDSAHNIFLEIAVSSGISGLIVFLLIIFNAFKNSNFTIKLSLTAFLIIASFNPLSIPEIVLFWFLLGVSCPEI